ncbi:hypothetical protein TREMEDRAFT_65909 [Tremella mesenterica DSM 1558]|uniref:uncharacterized protein n=1 Tax=Tremella mesenterica (strain ATCC 24925 / CBS 8224 / DSM 1558 / NBRC 9311 / NRRL Y-6157 / RJB 2259-6 / UBC 559-6) TaxID=578456 RepID=UPI00032D161C|nr:uncharacterized protein TREMEDRAFT_65909 [Tremella mesenterica DSM 1558]EIW66064.1 hypothetical protein TREMEDRAFT_65909 [Tremella mesenterica DSM 1558]
MKNFPSEMEEYEDSQNPQQDIQDIQDLTPLDRLEIFLPAVQSLTNALGGYEEIEILDPISKPDPNHLSNDKSIFNSNGKFISKQEKQDEKFETIYRPGDSVIAVLKDLKKLWRKDDTDDERTVARCMAKAGTMRELISLMVECTERGEWGRKVSLVACDLIAALTWPIDVQQELKEMEDEQDIVSDYASLLRYQVEYKAMILQSPAPLRCLLTLILPSLAKPKKDERDSRIISLGLHIVRNLLAIRDDIADGSAVGEKAEFSNLQSSLVIQLGQLTYFQLILSLASYGDKTDFNQYNVLVLDILHLVFRSVRAKDLAQDQARAPIENLSKLLESERRQKALHSKVGMTRHSRFGTTIAVKAGDQKLVLHKQNAITVDAGKILDAGKRKRAERKKRVDDPSRLTSYTPDAMRILQDVAKTFLEACFNTFFASVLKDIRMERSKIRPADNTRTLSLSRFFVEYLLLVRQKEIDKKATQQTKNGVNGDERNGEGNEWSLGLVGEMAELDSVRWVVGRMKITMDEKPPALTELQACLDCFTQILLLIDAMSLSTEEVDNEIAEILQNQLYYNGDVLDASLAVVTSYKENTGSVTYLDSVVHFAYVLLRMLERYSKTNTYMFVRKRKAAKKARKKTKGSMEGEVPEEFMGDEGVDEEDVNGEDERQGQSYKEHAFQFSSFEQRFAQESVVNTLLSHLSRFQEFDDPDQLKRVVGLMHRQVVKSQAEGLYFRVSCLLLFQRILDQQQSLPKHESSTDLIHLIKFILRKFFKKVKEDPFVIVEALGPKSRGKWKEWSSYKSEEDDDDDMGGQGKRIREMLEKEPTELEFKKNRKLSWSQQMGVIIGILLKDGHESWIRWIMSELEIALAQRQEVVLATDVPLADQDSEEEEGRARNFAGPSNDAIEKFVQHDIEPQNEEIKLALSKNSHFRLMLRLLSVERTENDIAENQNFFIPQSILPSNLETSLGALSQFLLSPPEIENPQTLLRRARKPRVYADTDSSGGSDQEGAEGVGEHGGRRRRRGDGENMKEKRRRKKRISSDGDGNEEEERPKRMKKRKQAEMQVYKSAAFILDSEEEEDDEVFFARERRLREEMEEMAKKQGNVMRSTGTKKRKKNKRGEREAEKKDEGVDFEGERDEVEHEDAGDDEVEQGDDEVEDRETDVEMEMEVVSETGGNTAGEDEGVKGHREKEPDEESEGRKKSGRRRMRGTSGSKSESKGDIQTRTETLLYK